MRKERRFKKYIWAVILLLMLIVVSKPSPVNSSSGDFLNDSFELGPYNWTTITGSWEVVDGQYTEVVDPAAIVAWTTAGSMSWADYSLEAQVTAADDDGRIYLAGRWQDEDTYYGLEYSNGNDGAASAKLTLYRMLNGVRSDLATHANAPYIGAGTTTPVTLQLVLKGANITVFANGTQVMSAADTSINYGKVALGELNRRPYFDNIKVKDNSPPQVFGVNVIDVTGTTAAITWETDEPASGKVDYGPTAAYGQTVKYSTLKNTHRVNLTNLALNTQYNYRITVTDAAGNSYTTGNLLFATTGSRDNVGPVIGGVAAAPVDTETLQVTWTTDEMANSTVEWGTVSGVYPYSLSYAEYVTGHTVTLQHLRANTTYYYRVISRDVAGNATVDAEQSVATPISYLPKVAAVVTDDGSATLTWLRNADVSEYRLYLSTDGNFSAIPNRTITETGANQYTETFSGLSNYVNYFIKVEGYKAATADDPEYKEHSIVRVFPPDRNPHGHYTNNPSLCGDCHTAHLAQGARLTLETTPTRLCLSCHDGSQSKYDVINGKVKKSGGGTLDAAAGPYGAVAGYSGTVSSTSKHDLNIPNKYAPGNNITNLAVSEANLACGTCHNPHGSDNYRNLRKTLRFSTSDLAGPTLVEAYAVTGAASETVTYVTGSINFCGNCHSDFNQSTTNGSIPVRTTDQPGFSLSLGSYDRYMHKVGVDKQYQNRKGVAITAPSNLPYENNKIICQTCHYAHGTANQGARTNRAGMQSTALVRFDHDQGCEGCHDKTFNP